MRARFVLPFNPETRQTIVPTDKDGQHLVEASHLSYTDDKTTSVICYVKGPEATITAMKADPAYTWLEDVPEPVAEVEAKPVEDEKPVEGEPVEEKPVEPVEAAPVAKAEPVDLKAAMITKFTKSAVDKLAWSTSDYAISSVCKLHGQTVENYKAGGLG